MSKVYDGIMGLVVSDALGVPVEFKERDTYHVTDMIGYGTHFQPPGTWSDDSSMTLATLDSIGQKGEINPTGIMWNFIYWYFEHEYTPNGLVFDIGNTTRIALERFDRNTPIENCGGRTAMDNGNGSLMRILPLAFVDHTDQDIVNVSSLTHAHPVSLAACIIYVEIAKNLMKGVPIDVAVYAASIRTGLSEYGRLKNVDKLSRDEIKSTGYVVDTLEAALWCLYHSESYSDCVLKAVNLGGDTDTIAAVAGGLAGLLYGVGGEKGIPERWIEQIPRREWIADLCEKVEQLNGCSEVR